jgi:response regulator receiver domain-containing protein
VARPEGRVPVWASLAVTAVRDPEGRLLGLRHPHPRPHRAAAGGRSPDAPAGTAHVGSGGRATPDRPGAPRRDRPGADLTAGRAARRGCGAEGPGVLAAARPARDAGAGGAAERVAHDRIGAGRPERPCTRGFPLRRTTMVPIRVLLADDHAVLRAGLRALIRAQPDLDVVGEAGDGDGAVQKAIDTAPDVVVMDLTMPGGGGVRRSHAAHPERFPRRAPGAGAPPRKSGSIPQRPAPPVSRPPAVGTRAMLRRQVIRPEGAA